MTFVSEAAQQTSLPSVDYIMTLSENLHINGAIQDMIVGDAFSTGRCLKALYLFDRKGQDSMGVVLERYLRYSLDEQ